jgi:CRISPR-associated protein Cas2
MDASCRTTYVVTYDISDPKRLRRVYQLMLGYGDHIQLSVFRCDLTAREVIELRAKLGAVIDCDADQVLFVDIGPAHARAAGAISSLGRRYVAAERLAVIL